MSLENMRGAQRVDQVLNDDQRLKLMEEYEAGRIRPAGALAYLKTQGVNTGGIDRMDVSDWLRNAVAPEPVEPEDDGPTDEELGAFAALSDEEHEALFAEDED